MKLPVIITLYLAIWNPYGVSLKLLWLNRYFIKTLNSHKKIL